MASPTLEHLGGSCSRDVMELDGTSKAVATVIESLSYRLRKGKLGRAAYNDESVSVTATHAKSGHTYKVKRADGDKYLALVEFAGMVGIELEG